MSKPIPGENIVELKPEDRTQNLRGYKFETFDEMAGQPPAKRWLIKNVFARGESSAWIGPPGSLKSALKASAAIHVAAGRNWFGYRSKEAAGVVYFAIERADLVRRQLQAHGARLGLKGLPIAVVKSTIDLTRPDAFKKVVDTIQDVEAIFGIKVGLVIIDTFAKLIAAAGGDENSAKDQGAVFANVQRVKNSADTHVALIGHTGKDETRGARGSNAILGDVDLMVTISGDVIRTATVTKANDAPEGPLFSFKSETHDFGIDEDGDPITVNIVSDETVSVQSAPKTGEPKLTANQKTLFGMLHAAGAIGLSLEDWNNQAREAGIGVKRKADLNDIRAALLSKRLIRQYGDISEHVDRARIERDLALGRPLRIIAKKYKISITAAFRHKAKLPPQLKAALAAHALKPGEDLERLRIDESEGLLGHLAAQRARLLISQDACLEAEQFGLVSQLASQVHRNIELVGKYLGEFASHSTRTTISILITPEYLDLRAALLRALQPYGDARRAVAATLHQVEQKAAQRAPLLALEATPQHVDGDAHAGN